MKLFHIMTNIIVVMSLGYYLIINLQWYNYKLQRLIFKHHKQQWHLIYFVLPIIFFYTLNEIYFYIYFYTLYITSLVTWYKKLDKPLIFTSRVKRFVIILFFITCTINILCTVSQNCSIGIFVPLLISWAISDILEKIFFLSFKHQAKQKLKNIDNLITIVITASYGKTSIKNYLYQVLNKKFNVYMTPRSVNTIGGIVKDINDDLPVGTEIYIAEAGAREAGDILEISLFLEHQYAILGNVGEQHIEYFKTLDNIIHTKMEVLKSPKLKYGFVHNSVPILKYDTISKFPSKLNIVKCNLDGIVFDVLVNNKIEHFTAPLLGSFNAINLTAVILTSHKLGMSIDEIKTVLQNLKPVKHRLHKSIVNGKTIIDDSFNGNLEGMLEAIKISQTHTGKKIIITPGLVESTKKANIQLANAIDKVFDFVIITGTLNAKILEENIISAKTLLLNDKKDLEDTLLEYTFSGDLILFANDAPNYL